MLIFFLSKIDVAKEKNMTFNYFCDIVFPSSKSFQKQKNQIKKDALTATFGV